MEGATKNKEQKDDALTAAYMLGRYDGRKEAEGCVKLLEKELAGADAEIAELRDNLEDSRGTEKGAPNVLCAIARLVGVYEHSQELGDDMGTLVLEAVSDLLTEKQKANAEIAKLTDVAYWLATRLSGNDDQKKCTVYADDFIDAAYRAIATESKQK